MPRSRTSNSQTRKQSTDAGHPVSKGESADTNRVDSAHRDRTSRFPASTDGPVDKLEVAVLDAYWARVSWLLTESTLRRAEKAFGREWPKARPAMRIRGLVAGDSSAHAVEQESIIPVPGDAREWFVDCPSEPFIDAQIGYAAFEPDGQFLDGRFFVLATAEPLATRAVTAPTIQPEHALPDDVLAELQQMREGGIGFSLSVEATLLLEGQTTAGALIGIGEEVLNADASGKFAYRFALENGRTVLPIEAESAARSEKRSGVVSADFNLRILDPREGQGA